MIREFRLQADRESEFVELHDGRWKRLSRSSEGYVRTELDKQVGLGYRVTDVWKSHYEFEAFLWKKREELKRFQEAIRANGIVTKEEQLGAFYGPGDEFDEGTLAPA